MWEEQTGVPYPLSQLTQVDRIPPLITPFPVQGHIRGPGCPPNKC